jgi:hypothetical protein
MGTESNFEELVKMMMESDMGMSVDRNEAIDFKPLESQKKVRVETEGKI